MLYFFHIDTAEQHEVMLPKVVGTLKNLGLMLNHKKCLLHQWQLNYLGHCIDEHGIRPDEAKVKAITDIELPSKVSGLRQIHYLGRYLPNLLEVTKPLDNLLKKFTELAWGPAQGEAFQRVKQFVILSYIQSPSILFCE